MTRLDRDTVDVLHNCGPGVTNVYRTGAVGTECVISPVKLAMHLLALANVTGLANDSFSSAYDKQLHPVVVEAAACAALSLIGAVTERDIPTNLADLVPLLQAGRNALGTVSRRATERACARVTEVRDLLPTIGAGAPFCGVVKWSHALVEPDFTSSNGSAVARLAQVRHAAVSLMLIAYATPPIVLMSRDASLHYFQRDGALTARSFATGGAA